MTGPAIKKAKSKYRSPRLEVLHKTAASLARIGAFDKQTMREFDAFCLTKVAPMTGDEILALREREGVSQAILAHYLNVGTKVVADWEQGVKRPSGASLKLLSLVRAKGLDRIA